MPPVPGAYAVGSGQPVYAGRGAFGGLVGGLLIDAMLLGGLMTPGIATGLTGGLDLGAMVLAGQFVDPLPTWRVGATPWTSIRPFGNTVADVDSALNPAENGNAPQTRNNANWTPDQNLLNYYQQWSGFAWCEPLQEMTLIGGGHQGVQSNHGYRATLKVNAPAFVAVGSPTGSISFPIPGGSTIKTIGANSGLLADGRPASVHSYNLDVALTNGDIVLVPSGGRDSPGGGIFTSNGYTFKHSTSNWDTSYTFLQGSSNAQACAGCEDGAGNIWSLQDRNLTKWDAATGAKTVHISGGDLLGYYSTLIYDKQRNLIWIWIDAGGGGSLNSNRLLYVDPTAPTVYHPVTIDTGTASYAGYAITRDTRRDVFVLWFGSTTDLTIVTPPANINSGTFVTTTHAVTGGLDPMGATGAFMQIAYSELYDGVIKNSDTSLKPQFIPFS